MHLFIVLLLTAMTLFLGIDCHRHVRHRVFRQPPQLFEGSEEEEETDTYHPSQLHSRQVPVNPNQNQPNIMTPPFMPTPAQPLPPVPVSEPQSSNAAEGMNIYPEQPAPPAVTFSPHEYPPNIAPLPPAVTPPIPPAQPDQMSNSFRTSPDSHNFNSFMRSNYTPASVTAVSYDVNPVFKSPNFTHRRKRKNVLHKNDKVVKLLDAGKKLMELSTLDGILGENDFLVSDDIGKNVTTIPLPKGVQLVLISRKGDTKINETVNITSSTQRSVALGNSTEIENVVEMEMQKKIEDEKGANKGLEEIRIVETEHVKPLNRKSWKNLQLRSKRKMVQRRRRRFGVHHRSKRSSEEMAKSDSVFNKMAKRFFSKINKKERVSKESSLPNHGLTLHTDYRGGVKSNHHGEIKQNEELAYHRSIINDFMKFFSMEMKKFQKIQEKSKNGIRSVRHLNSSRRFHDGKLSVYKIKKRHQWNYPERMKIILNTNMSWETKIVIPRNESRRETEEQSTSVQVATSAAVTPEESAKELITEVLLLKSNSTDTRFLAGLLCLSTVMLVVGALIWTLSRYRKFRRLTSDSTVKSYRFHQQDKTLDLKGDGRGKEYNDYPPLEWQSESGDWLSEQETEFR